MWVLGPPAATSRTMLAPSGVGVGVGVGLGAVLGDGLGVGLGVGLGGGGGVGVGLCAAIRTSHTGKKTRTLRNFTRRPKGTSDRRPRNRPGRGGFGESPARVEHAPKPAPQHVDLRWVEQPVEGARQLA